ncbi:MAG: hypothetical protein IMW89_09550 [Ktedonobacteraceae bacterium]|nr:hypothetical protein [Ktedonobacteraceae bacterium]
MLGFVSLLIAACGGGASRGGSPAPAEGANSSGGSTPANYTVHMTDTNFAQSSITISKGSSITLTNDSGALHIISNGRWVNGNAQAAQEGGAPTVSNLQIAGNASQTIGPFNMAGTYHLYCPIHPGMNLTVIVQ